MPTVLKTGELDRNVVAARLRERRVPHAESLSSLAAGSWRIATNRVGLEDLKIGQSRFGGVPDLPPHTEWPTRDDRPLAFLAQINLTEIAAAALPGTGWLLFFYDCFSGGLSVIHFAAAK
jgi:hypothetical protein